MITDISTCEVFHIGVQLIEYVSKFVWVLIREQLRISTRNYVRS